MAAGVQGSVLEICTEALVALLHNLRLGLPDCYVSHDGGEKVIEESKRIAFSNHFNIPETVVVGTAAYVSSRSRAPASPQMPCQRRTPLH